jgi:Mitochondrial domain of unknown function (DUF1713)
MPPSILQMHERCAESGVEYGPFGVGAIFGVLGKPSKVLRAMGSLIKKRRKRMRKKKHKKMLKRTRFQRRAAGK